MAKLNYSISDEEIDPERTAKALGRELRISPKHAVEVCREIRGMGLTEAKDYLEKVARKEQPVPFRKHKKKVSHRKKLKKWPTGQYPMKAVNKILDVLKNAEANAEYKGLDIDRLIIKHIAPQKGPVIRGFRPRAFGRTTPSNTPTTNIEIVLEEK